MKTLSTAAPDGRAGRATIHDVARAAGVSIATVSRVINAPESVRAETLARVQAVLRELDYVPHGAGRGLASGKTLQLGFLLLVPRGGSRGDAFFMEILRGIEAAVEAAGYAVTVSVRSREEAGEAAVPRILGGGRVDGLIITGGPVPARYLEAARRGRLPLVLLGPQEAGPGVWWVTIDSRRGSEEAVGHLLGLGRRRLAHISGPAANATSASKRDGYLLAHSRAGLAVDERLHVVEEALHSREGGQRAIRRLLEAGVDFDAVYANDDLLALGALATLAAAGRRVPDDVAVVGYGDLDEARFADPPLTTSHVDFYGQGWLAGTVLVQALDGVAPATLRIKLDTRLIVRASSGAPAAEL